MAIDTAGKLQARHLSDRGLQAFLETNKPELVKEWPRKAWGLDGLVQTAFERAHDEFLDIVLTGRFTAGGSDDTKRR